MPNMLRKSLCGLIIVALPFTVVLAQSVHTKHLPLHVDVSQQRVFNTLIAPHAKLELLTSSANWSEGPLVLKDHSVIWSDITNNRVLQWHDKKGVSTWLSPAQFQNGHAMDQEGRILAASHGKRAIERLEADGKWHVLVDLYHDKKLNSPNDLIVDKDGEIWFTDPLFGIKKDNEGYGGNPVAGGEFSYRFNPKTKEIVRLHTPEVKTPNGIALSPDEKILYIAESELGHNTKDKSLKSAVVAYDIDEQKTLKNGRLLANVPTGVADGIAVDQHGNIWTTGGKFIYIFSPKGQTIARIQFPTVVANLVFATQPDGKRIIYVTGSDSLYRLNNVLVSGK